MTDDIIARAEAAVRGLVYISDGTRGSEKVRTALALVPELVAELKAIRERHEDCGCGCGTTSPVRHACHCGAEVEEVDNGFDNGYWCPTHGRQDVTYVCGEAASDA